MMIEIKIEEVWKKLIYPNSINNYEVSSCGKFRNINNHRIYKFKLTNGYLTTKVRLINSKYKDQGIHRLVAYTFIENPNNKPFVNHKDGNKSNNHIDNLEWVTQSENTQHYYNELKTIQS